MSTMYGHISHGPLAAHSGCQLTCRNTVPLPQGSANTHHTETKSEKTAATVASTIGYSGEIFDRQKRQRPRRRNQPNTGMFSRQVRRVSQEGQREGGSTTLIPSGMR